jgi:phenylacetate-coenzyme A ligase PaaK-like adenylate-forming protein
MYSKVVAHLLFPFHERIKGKPTFPWLRRLEKSQWMSPAQLRELQWVALRKHLEFAYAHVPYYRRLLDEHEVPPWRVQSLEDFRRIPYLTREDLRTSFDELQARVRLPRVTRRTSGGSTGVPAVVMVDMERMGFGEAVRLRAHRWFGLEPGAREICLWGSPIELTRQDRLRVLRDRLLNSRVLSAFRMSEALMAGYGRAITRFAPEKMVCYAHAAYVLATYLRGTGWRPPASLRAVFTTAEMLFDFQRRAIQDVFGARAAVEYGARDAGVLASECPSGRLHIPAEGILLEVDDAGPDGLGEIVVTNLLSAAMPIIRYRIGDMGELDPTPCPCGRTLPCLKRLEGRRIDFLVTPEGLVMHPQAVVFILREVHPIQEFQIVQEAVDRLSIRIVPDAGFTEATRQAILQRVEQVMGPAVRVEVELTEAIARAPSGKYRFVISKVADEYLSGALKAGA